jgi:hypothetical protein
MAWKVWFYCRRYLPDDAKRQMRDVESTADCILMALQQFEKRILEKLQAPVTQPHRRLTSILLVRF